jgi:hypothetical protein
VKRVLAYAATCIVLVFAVLAGLGRVLDQRALLGLALAGAVAAALQVMALGARIRWGTTPNRLLATWVWSMGARFTSVLAMGLAAWRYDELDVVTSLVGLAGFLFVMLLMEPAFFSPGPLEMNDGEIARG